MSSKLKDPSVVAKPPKRGRPPSLTEDMRRDRILQAAERVFTTIGYGATTMEEIAQAAGMSKKTLYGVFPDKRGLFTALIGDIDLYPSTRMHDTRADSREALRKRLLTLAELALGRRQVEMTRLVISEARHCPELTEEFHARAIRKGKDYLAHALRSYSESNPRNAIVDVESTAVALFGAVIGDLHLRALLGDEPLSRRQLQRHIDSAMDLILPVASKRA